MKFDNANVLKLLKDKEAAIDTRGNFSAEELAEYISTLKEGVEVSAKEFPAYLATFISASLNASNKGNPSVPVLKLSLIHISRLLARS